ncbi:MAG TPA: ribosome maturation factor RimP [Pseudomonadota bacterium]|jgi:ribosome maturation factor RimP|nr:ribosome maturation factor RimP [Pseudomonadota bacterium]
MKPVDLKALHKLVEPVVDGQGYELVDLDWTRGPSGWVLRVTMDRLPGQGHVSHADCASVSREVSALLDVHDVLPVAYSLEVSSPGVDRPLKKSADFARFVGKKAKIRLRPDAQQSFLLQGPLSPEAVPRRNFSGTIASVDGERVKIAVDGAGEFELVIGEIEKANAVFEFV